MKLIAFRTDESQESEIIGYADKEGFNKSDALRALVDKGLDKSKQNDIDLTIARRILEKLDKQTGDLK